MMLNPDLLLDICNQLLGSNDASISKIQALNKFRLSGKECFWAFENAAKSAVSARLRFLNKTQHFSLIVQYKHDIKAELPYLPEDDNTLFIKALENIKVLSLGNVSVLPSKILAPLVSNLNLVELDMERVVEFPHVADLKQLKLLSCPVTALFYFAEKKMKPKLETLKIQQSKARLVFEALTLDCFEAEQIFIETFTLNPTVIQELNGKRLETVKRLSYKTSEHSVHGTIPEILSSVLDNLLSFFPSLEVLEFDVKTEPVRISNEGEWSISPVQINQTREKIQEILQKYKTPPNLQLKFSNRIYARFLSASIANQSRFEAEFSDLFSENKFEDEKKCLWQKTEKISQNVEFCFLFELRKQTTEISFALI